MKACDCKCCKCGKQAVAFWPVCDPDIPSYPYCRECLDKEKRELMIKLMEIDKKYKLLKSYTDLEQSKKLAEILPTESADMYYHNRVDIPDNFPLPIEWKHNNPLLSQEIPCWSLAALLSVLPKQIGRYTKTLYWFDDAWHCEYVDEDSEGKNEVTADNPIDACYGMIIKLNELKML